MGNEDAGAFDSERGQAELVVIDRANLQTQYNIEIAENELGDRIDQEVMPIAA